MLFLWGNSMSTELFLNNGCYTVASLRSWYLPMYLQLHDFCLQLKLSVEKAVEVHLSFLPKQPHSAVSFL
jgi:hypothetical protein